LHLMQLYRERQNILKTKKIHDREIIKLFSYQLNFSEVDNVLIRYIVNPIYYVLYKVFILFVWFVLSVKVHWCLWEEIKARSFIVINVEKPNNFF